MSKQNESRKQLKGLFQAGSMPSGQDFSILIDSQLNARDDMIGRQQVDGIGNTLTVGAGNNGALMSFFADLSRKGSGWSLLLANEGTDLEIKPVGAIEPSLYLSRNGNVGIGTDSPQALLEVDGAIQADSLSVTNNVQAGTLEVNGTAVIKTLILNGKTISASDDGIVTSPPSDFSASAVPQTQSASQMAGDQPLILQQSLLARVGQLSGQVAQLQQQARQSVGSASAAPEVKQVPANGQFQDLISGLEGYSAFELIAWVNDKPKNYSIVHATVVNVNGDYSNTAITTTASYMGNPRGQVELRWQKDPGDTYKLQGRTRSNLSGVNIHFFYHGLLPSGLPDLTT